LFLTHSFEVEGIEDLAKGLDKVVVGEVLTVEKHPDADRLNVAKVNVGKENGGELQIVCGAPNLATGQKVPVALVGAKLITKDKDGKEQEFEIKQSKIRGVESFGMICAEDELGVGDDHEGIMVLDGDVKIGEDFAEYLGLRDKVLDIDILPNRGHDCLSYRGVALELQALEGNKAGDMKDEIQINLKSQFSGDNDLNVKIDTPSCARYAGVRIKNIEIKPSPRWMQARLKASGVKPINNVVDITNYVMLETGQPLHAFTVTRSQVDGSESVVWENPEIVVRQAKEGEKIVLLDEQEIELTKDDIVITDGQRPIALAGIMGGLDSGVQPDTTEIILEGANFNSVNIRFTKRRYNIDSDAGYRFERDIDPNLVDEGLGRAVELIKELAGGEVFGVTDVYPEPVEPWTVDLRLDYVRRLLGVDISEEKVKNILERLGITVSQSQTDADQTPADAEKENQEKNNLICTIPTRRRDLRTEEDLIEEVGRIYGYDKIKPVALREAVRSPHRNEQRFFERRIKDIAVQSGFSEIRSYSFHSEKDAEVLGLKRLRHIELLNPASPEQQMLRNTLAIGVLKAGRKNLSYFKEVRVFEIGKVYKVVNDEVLPKEVLSFAGGVFSKGKNGEQFYEMKGLLDTILESFGISDCYYDDIISDEERSKGMPELHPSRQALLKTSSGVVLGWLGEVNKKTAKYFGLKNTRGAIFEIEVDRLRAEQRKVISFQSLPKFPFVERDLSMIVPEKLKVGEVQGALFRAGGKLLRDVDLFDLYQNKETGEKSMAFHLVFGDKEKTLESKEIDGVVEGIVKTLENELGVQIRK